MPFQPIVIAGRRPCTRMSPFPWQRKGALLFVGLFCLLAMHKAHAGVTGNISGIVTDKSGAVIDGAQVVAHSLETGIDRTTISDQKGFYSFLALPVGTYTVLVSKDGFKEFKQTSLSIDANSAVRVDVRLQVGGVHEENWHRKSPGRP